MKTQKAAEKERERAATLRKQARPETEAIELQEADEHFEYGSGGSAQDAALHNWQAGMPSGVAGTFM